MSSKNTVSEFPDPVLLKKVRQQFNQDLLIHEQVHQMWKNKQKQNSH